MDTALQHPTTIRPKLPLSSMENSLKFISSIFQTAIPHLNSPVQILSILLLNLARSISFECLDMAYSRDGNFLAVVTGRPDFSIYLYDLKCGREIT